MSLKPKLPSDRTKPSHEMPGPPPPRNLCGPETIVGRVREVVDDKVRLWNDPSDRWHIIPASIPLRVFDDALRFEYHLAVTVEKLRGRWTVTKVEAV